MKEYNHKNIEEKWQKDWEEKGIYKTADLSDKPKQYVLDMFPYPSGAGLHVGHPRGYIGSDIFARFKRMKGCNVLHPMGFDSFGLPAEQYAIKTGNHPGPYTDELILQYKKQLSSMGFSYDWSREVATHRPEYYKWTQWIFLQLYNSWYNPETNKTEPIDTCVHKLKQEDPKWNDYSLKEKQDILMNYRIAYEGYAEVNWCPELGTVLANDEVITSPDGTMVSERGEHPVYRKSMRQWFMRTSAYAERLLNGLDTINWPHGIKEIQRNWIGKSEGSKINFKLKVESDKVRESFKFRPELAELVKRGQKNITFRMEQKNVSVGDTVSLIDWADGKEENQAEFLQAKITNISEFKLIDLPLDYPGHEKDYSVEERLIRYQEYYGKDITNESPVCIYEFEPLIVPVFTTRADTLFGVTYVVLAPEHELVLKLKDTIQNYTEVEKYIAKVKTTSEDDRINDKNEKTGICLEGIFAINPANGEQVPVWIADYVLAGYGTGAVMAVPAHDERDFEFATKYDLPIRNVIVPPDLYRAIVVAITLTDGDIFKQKLIDQNISYYTTTSKISKREHIRIDLSSNKLDNFIALVQQFLTGNNWVEILGTKDILILKDSVHENYLVDSAKWFVKFLEWEPLISGQKNMWTMLGKNDFLRPLLCYTESGILKNSEKFDGLTSTEAREKITEFVSGKIVTKYKMRDAIFARQRYWGEPIPLRHDSQGIISPLPNNELPLELPDLKDFAPAGDGNSALSKSPEWLEKGYELNTMPGWAGSSWYFLRYMDPHNNDAFVSRGAADYWGQVDMYVGGAEHATGHLLYSRFWNMALHDLGYVPFAEPFARLRNQGMIAGTDGRKMSKRWGNVINPDDVVAQLGADTLRVYESFMGPFEAHLPWSTDGIVGSRRFVEKIYRACFSKISDHSDKNVERLLHKTIKKVTGDIEDFSFNTSISAMMIFINEVEKSSGISKKDFVIFLKLLAPFAPHITEELYQSLRVESEKSKEEVQSIHLSTWPNYDESLTIDNEITIAVSVNGKARAEITVREDMSEDDVLALACSHEKIIPWVQDKDVKKKIYVKGRIVNLVVA